MVTTEDLACPECGTPDPIEGEFEATSPHVSGTVHLKCSSSDCGETFSYGGAINAD